MGHYCWVCGRTRANERFSGKGHARHICKQCARLPREERDQVQARRDMEGFLHQSNISAGDIARLTCLCGSSNEEVRRKAALVLEVARARPGKRRRWTYLARTRPALLDRLVEEGLLPEDAFPASQAAMGRGRQGSKYDRIMQLYEADAVLRRAGIKLPKPGDQLR